MDGLPTASAARIAAHLRRGDVGALELLDHLIARIERHDGRINAVVARNFERAQTAARDADTAWARGETLGPLHGVPMTLKDGFDIAGLPTTWGVPAFRNNLAARDSAVAERLRRAGAVLFGKTNIPFMLSDYQSYNEIHGTTENPWKPGHTPGGSSGGAAAAVTAGFTALEFGTDVGGSVRQPAHCCGLFGHKPTYGIVPMRGHALPEHQAPIDIWVAGPLARSAEDLVLSLDIVAGAGGPAAPGWRLDLPHGPAGAKGLRVALWADDPMAPVDDAIRDGVVRAARALEEAGAVIDDTARPDFSTAHCHETYLAVMLGAHANWLPDTDFDQAVAGSRSLPPGDRSPETRAMRGTVARHRDWVRQNEARWAMRWAWKRFFERHDVLLCPPACAPAFPHDHSEPIGARTLKVNGRDAPYMQQLFWAGLTGISYLPSSVAPAGRTADGLPVGVQIVGPEMGDRTTIAVAAMLERMTGGFEAPPGFD
ncbi:MAG: amidase [Minwuia sp.]|uniref:amidase n=1 Tax=Minwuia sp. TaxID=2493630 RepID=UPI003A8AB75C